MSEIVRDPNKIDIYDTTGRDGLQTVDVSMSLEDRVMMSQQLESIGVDIIEAGFPASGEATTNHELEVVQAVAVAVDSAKVAALCRLRPADIENGWAGVEPAKDNSGGVRLHTFISTSDVQMKEQRLTPEKVKELTASEVARAKSFCDDVEFSPMDASRSDFELVMEVCRIAVENGATVINIPDTTGYMTYRQYGRLIAAVMQGIQPSHPNVVFSAHTHGDRGLSTASNMEAIGAGARQAEVAVNGLGPRLGNADLASIVGNIREGGNPLPSGAYTGVDSRRLVETSRMVAKLSGKPAPSNLPFTSPTAFAHVEGIHQHDVVGNPRSFEALDAAVYGQEPGQIVLGPLSGRVGVSARLENIGIRLEGDELNAVTTQVKDLATKEGRNLADTDIERIAAEYKGQTIEDPVALGSIDIGVAGFDFSDPVFEIVLLVDGKERYLRFAATGKDQIHRAVQAINRSLGFETQIKDWHGDALREGSDAGAEIFVDMAQSNGRPIKACAKGNDVLEASIKAYLAGISIIKRIEQRAVQDAIGL
ncbi:MAG TPA: alpha-isopropylmalate synthase regulatory domain-containing protein [Candidatus Dormibacteraeota bacterium]|nr:alpha-isopropylmalate synthase regulatory domain-containing protein [Candidatus Dormibacteraeota bacterium]